MMLCGRSLEMVFLVKRGKVLAYAIHESKEKALEHLKKVAKFHGLKGKILESKELEEKFGEMIKKSIEKGLKFRVPESYKFCGVYKELVKIPRGKVVSYGEIAERAKLHTRQVVLALKHNPFPILIPCHRVIRKNGEIGGYTPLGTKFKKMLLEMEKLGSKKD